ncbi:MAG TPA: MlaD family protein [Nocardioidaceae bacterium]|nr:MlaD family protein [Nocardioidaceae bacterium]
MNGRDRSDRQLVRLALIGMLTMVVMFLLAINFGRLPLVSGGTTYSARFSDAAGLVKGEEVRVAGIKVGSVTDIALDQGTVLVSFKIDGVELGDQTSAGIEVKTLLGQHYLSLTPAGSGDLGSDDTIPLDRTTTPVNIVPAFQQLATQSAEIDTTQVAHAFDALSEVLERTAPDMKSTLRGLSRLSHAVASRDDEIRALFARTNEVSGVVAARDHELAELLGSTNDVLGVLDRRRETINRIIGGTAGLARQLTGLVQDNEAELAPALAKLTGVLDVLRANRRQLDEIIDMADVYGREFVNVGGSGRWFDATIKAPRSFAICNEGTGNGLVDTLINSLLSEMNQGINQSSRPCAPLGPATGGTP